MRGLFILLLGLGVGACHHPTQPEATVFFAIDAPLCSSIIPVQLSIDGMPAVTDTFVVNLGPRTHTVSRGFTTSAGTHTLGARVPQGYVWADTSVTLAAGQSFTRSLPFYCS